MGLLKGILWYSFLTVAALWLLIGVFVWTHMARDSLRIRRLLRRLASRDATVRRAAAESIGADRTIEADERLVRALDSEADAGVRAAIIHALAPISLELLRDAESAADYARRSRGAATLTTGGNPEHYLKALRGYIIPGLVKALESGDRREREAAAMALMWINSDTARQALEDNQISLGAPEQVAPAPDDVQLSVYYPEAVQQDREYDAHLYLYTRNTLRLVYENLLESRGGVRAAAASAARRTQRLELRRGVEVTVVAEATGLDVAPSSYTKPWQHEWLHFPFAFRVSDGRDAGSCELRLSLMVNEIEVASVTCAIIQADGGAEYRAAPTSRFRSQSTVPYQSIFVSYSHHDSDVVDLYRRVQEAVGNDVFVDAYSIRAGDQWKDAIEAAIGSADILQLFWSEHSATSSQVREEWTYALVHRCPQSRCVGFIRPVYWVKPMPAEPPPELRHLHFRYAAFGESR